MTGTALNEADHSYAQLSGAASLHGTDFTNAILKSANLLGVELGGLNRLFTLAAGSEKDLNGDKNVDKALRDQFKNNPLSATATLSILDPDRLWEISDPANNIVYSVRLDDTTAPVVYAPAAAGKLTGAYMPAAVLHGANLYGVVADGIQFYGGAGQNALIDGVAILEAMDLANSNLSSLDLTNARLMGVVLSGAHLFNTKLNGANLTLSPKFGKAADLTYSNLQGADFTDAQLYGADLTDAAVAVSVPTKAYPQQGGVYLFSLPYAGDPATLQAYIDELNAGAMWFSLNPRGDDATLQKYVAALESNDLATLKIPFLQQRPPIVLSQITAIQSAGGDIWQLLDQSHVARYNLWVGVDPKGGRELYAAPVLPNLAGAFRQNSTDLELQTRITSDSEDQQWLLDNDSENPHNATPRYVRYLLKRARCGNKLDVYGTAIRIQRLGDDNKSELHTETCNVTTLGPGNMSDDSMCPNGRTLLANKNATGRPWDDAWLRSGQKRPSPPSCVPTDYSWCPRDQDVSTRSRMPAS
jgi:uncharacterized protein YjbI with pentapeptide repeats